MVAKDKISRPYDGEKTEIAKGEYDEIEKLFNEINRKVDLDNFSYSIDPNYQTSFNVDAFLRKHYL